MHKQCRKTNELFRHYLGDVRISQDKQAKVERLLEELSLKNKEMTNQMEKLRRVNEEVSVKNNELSLELENLKRISQDKQAEVERQLEELSLKNKEMKNEMEKLRCVNEVVSLKNNDLSLELENLKKHQAERELTRCTCNGQVHEGTTTANAAEEGWFDPAQLNRFINESHERQIKLTEIRGKLIEEVLDEEDEALKELKACGQGIYDVVVEALKEMDKYNSSGRTIVPELWNYREGRKATVVEGIDCLKKKMMEHENEKNCNKRRRSLRPR
ncbi:hypothetical protein HU200_062805 [Digitaria exilis]|uniref:Factor of DNA methylation 1-5/IDN2 domain-containing protein n=1 Tax=Digitaria exilis TaxID=1010633 RepID=A0A835DY40_9POAL|nr:hypothetical protein HU200_062805 [Digitaria exilis]